MTLRRGGVLTSLVMVGLTFGLVQARADESGCSSALCTLLQGPKVVSAPPVAADEADTTTAAAPEATVAPRAKPKPAPRPVVIGAGDADVASTQSLAAALRGHATKVVKALSGADVTVAPQVAGVSAQHAAPLFRDELHLIGRAGIVTLADLEGRTVSFGPAGSPAQVLARRVLAARHVTVTETPLDLDNALDGLATGDIDAVAVLAPQPFAKLRDLQADGLHLVPIDAAGIDLAAVAPATIPAPAYPRLTGGTGIDTISVAVAATVSPRAAHRPDVAAVLAALTARAQRNVAAAATTEMRSAAVAK